MTHALKIESLTRRFGKFVALDNVTFDIPSNTIFGLLGPNGAGKTTLFSIASGFIRADAGSIEVLGIDVRNIGELRGRFSMLPQDASFQSGIPVLEQLVMFARLNGMTLSQAREASMEALHIVGLSEFAKRNARALSHGMAKRVALCQAFLGSPEVVFLDEPTAGLDPENARKIRDLMRAFVQNKTVVISSHNLQEIQDICSDAAILHKGRLVACGKMSELTQSSMILRVGLESPLPEEVRLALMKLPYVQNIEEIKGNEFSIRFSIVDDSEKSQAMRSVHEALARFSLYPTMMRQGASLESRFLELTGGLFDGGSSS